MDSLELTIVTSVSDGDDEHFYVCPSFETTATNDAAPQNEARRLGGGVVHHRKGVGDNDSDRNDSDCDRE